MKAGKGFLGEVIFPLALIGLLLLLFKPLYIREGVINYLYMWILVGIPFGMRKMCMWLIPWNYGISGTVGIVALNFIIGGLIGGGVVMVRIIQAIWYCIKTVGMVFRKSGKA